MRILLTNDDGIDAIGIRLVAEWAKTLGELTVVAPKVEQSGMSHAIDFTHPIEIKKVDFMEGVEAYSMASTPADCVRFGVLALNKKFDLILSGVKLDEGDKIKVSQIADFISPPLSSSSTFTFHEPIKE